MAQRPDLDLNVLRRAELYEAAKLSRRRFLFGAAGVGLAAAAAPLIAACSGGAATSAPVSAVPTAAPSAAIGGKVFFIGWEGFEGASVPYLEKFRKDNNIEQVNTFVGSPDDMLAKIATDPAHTNITTTHIEAYMPAYKAGLLEPLDMSKLPNFETFYPVFKGPHWIYPDGQRYAIPAAWGNSPIVYDPAKWDGVPDRFYPDLADPKYKGHLVIMDDPYTNLFDISQALGHKDPMFLTQAELDEVVKAFKEVKKNVVAIVGGGLSDLMDMVVRGDASMIPFQGWQPQVKMAREKGKELKFAEPKETPGFWWVDNYAMPKQSTNKETTYALINAMISPEGAAGIDTASASGTGQSKAYDLIEQEVRDWYPYEVVQNPNLPKDHPISISLDPPAETEGDIVGIAEWKRAWQEAKLG